MNVRVQVELLVPGVQYGQHGDGAADVARIAGELDDRAGRRLHQHGVTVALMRPQHRAQFGRHGDGDVEIRRRQHLRLPAAEPFLGLGSVALGAAAIAARMVREHIGVACIAAPDLAAEDGGAAVKDVFDGASVRWWDRRAVCVQVVRRKAAEHVGDLGHDRLRQRPVISWSSNPCSEAREGVVRWV